MSYYIGFVGSGFDSKKETRFMVEKYLSMAIERITELGSSDNDIGVYFTTLMQPNYVNEVVWEMSKNFQGVVLLDLSERVDIVPRLSNIEFQRIYKNSEDLVKSFVWNSDVILTIGKTSFVDSMIVNFASRCLCSVPVVYGNALPNESILIT